MSEFKKLKRHVNTGLPAPNEYELASMWTNADTVVVSTDNGSEMSLVDVLNSKMDTNGQIDYAVKAGSLNLSTGVGGRERPVYFKDDGTPFACVPYSEASVLHAKSATYAENAVSSTNANHANVADSCTGNCGGNANTANAFNDYKEIHIAGAVNGLTSSKFNDVVAIGVTAQSPVLFCKYVIPKKQAIKVGKGAVKKIQLPLSVMQDNNGTTYESMGYFPVGVIAYNLSGDGCSYINIFENYIKNVKPGTSGTITGDINSGVIHIGEEPGLHLVLSVRNNYSKDVDLYGSFTLIFMNKNTGGWTTRRDKWVAQTMTEFSGTFKYYLNGMDDLEDE